MVVSMGKLVMASWVHFEPGSEPSYQHCLWPLISIPSVLMTLLLFGLSLITLPYYSAFLPPVCHLKSSLHDQ